MRIRVREKKYHDTTTTGRKKRVPGLCVLVCTRHIPPPVGLIGMEGDYIYIQLQYVKVVCSVHSKLCPGRFGII